MEDDCPGGVLLRCPPPLTRPVCAGASVTSSKAGRAGPDVVGARLHVDRESAAQRQVDAWRVSRPADAMAIARIATQPMAVWMGGWNRNVRGDVARVVAAAAQSQALPVLVAYNLPDRDCGCHSAGGAPGAASYRRWTRSFADGLAGRGAIVILEPDGLALIDRLSPEARRERLALLREAVERLASCGAAVYLDAGHPRWVDHAEMASRLRAAGVEEAHGFALNVSNFHGTQENVTYGEAVSRGVGGRHFVIDTSRNGAGSPGGQWCNPRGTALGAPPTTRTGLARVDAYLWVKRPGESDGPCNGGPAAGSWWPEYALELARGSRG
jgi:endoglucanase